MIDPQLGGVLSNQSLEFDRTDEDLLYWVATTSTMSDKNAQLVRFDLSKPATPTVKSVSYTHLDVYKRQSHSAPTRSLRSRSPKRSLSRS